MVPGQTDVQPHREGSSLLKKRKIRRIPEKREDPAEHGRVRAVEAGRRLQGALVPARRVRHPRGRGGVDLLPRHERRGGRHQDPRARQTPRRGAQVRPRRLLRGESAHKKRTQGGKHTGTHAAAGGSARQT